MPNRCKAKANAAVIDVLAIITIKTTHHLTPAQIWSASIAVAIAKNAFNTKINHGYGLSMETHEYGWI